MEWRAMGGAVMKENEFSIPLIHYKVRIGPSHHDSSEGLYNCVTEPFLPRQSFLLFLSRHVGDWRRAHPDLSKRLYQAISTKERELSGLVALFMELNDLGPNMKE